MVKRNRDATAYTIPQNLNVPSNSDWVIITVCIPNDAEWYRVFSGHISRLAKGYWWARDERPNSIIQARDIGLKIWESIMCIGPQSEILNEIRRMRHAIEGTKGFVLDDEGNQEYVDYTVNPTDGKARSIRDGILALDNSLNFDDLITELETLPDAAPVKDWLETFYYIRNLLPNISFRFRLPSIWPVVSYLFEMRHRHNDLTLQAYQATALRGIQNALAPFEGDNQDDEETIATRIYDNLDKLPWMLTVAGALAEPTPAGETVVALKMGATALSWYNWIKNGVSNWWNYIVNTVEDPQPEGTVVGMLSQISRKIRENDDPDTLDTQIEVLIGVLEGIRADMQSDTSTRLDDIEKYLKEVATMLGSDIP